MKKKSLVAMGLAGVMTVGMCVPVLAEDNKFNQDSVDGQRTEVSITEPVSYSVTIPSVVSLEKGSTKEISVQLEEGAVLETSGNVNVAISDLDGSSTLKLKSGDNAEISSTVTLPDTQILNKTTNELKYIIGAVTGLQDAGIYKGSITFTISYQGIDFNPTTPAVE